MLSARSLVLSFAAISSFGASIILFTASLTSAGFAIERRGVAVAAADRDHIVGPLAYANPEDQDLGPRYSVRPRTRTPPSGSPLNAAAMTVIPKPNVVVVNGQQIEIVSPGELSVRSPPPLRKATTTVLAQALSTIAGALAGLSVGLFLIRWRSVRISKLGLHKSLASL